MRKALALVFAVAFPLASSSFAQSILGIRIGEPPAVLEKLNLTPTGRQQAGSAESVKYVLATGNELSVTYERSPGRIVYLEHDWNRKPESAGSEFAGFKFGTTTLEEIRATNGNNGFAYRSNAANRIGGELFTFNCYHIQDQPKLVVAFVTALNVAELKRQRENNEPGAENIAKNLKLDAVILADEDYLDKIWGEQKTRDPAEHSIRWPQ